MYGNPDFDNNFLQWVKEKNNLYQKPVVVTDWGSLHKESTIRFSKMSKSMIKRPKRK